jgi:tetratricopeptide (TPR) repeat protein
MTTTESIPGKTPKRKRYVPVVGPRLRRLLAVVLGLFALLAVNSVYLVSVSLAQWAAGRTFENYFYQWMFLGHLVLGLLIVLPVIGFGILHLRNAWHRPNRRAVRAGLGLFATSLVVLATGVLLTRAFVDLKDERLRSVLYWVHVVSPLAVVWLFVLHRLAGRRIRWRVGVAWAGVGAGFAVAMTLLHSQDPRQWDVEGPSSAEQYFFPSLARTATGRFIPARTLMNDGYCRECHADIHEQWRYSAHALSSFNNPAYGASVRESRQVLARRDGSARGSRFCAGCHDLVPFFSGEFEDPRFDDPQYDLAADPMGSAGITCTGCHAITNINSVRGNADYTIEEPIHYPFTFSDNGFLKWINEQLVKAKPGFHKKTFLKPLHRTPEFCGACHKVHLPVEVNDYKFLRGQNHYDSFLLSGVSGHGVSSFYYPPRAEPNCNGCHMPLAASEDFGARPFETDPDAPLHGEPAVHDHTHREFLQGVMRVDLFGVKAGGTIWGELTAPLEPEVPALQPGASYLLETVVRTVRIGHFFTQGTADSNEVWLDVTVSSGDRVIGRSGGQAPDGQVDPWSHFVNAFVLDRAGNRIDRRNAQDIFVPLYDHQIPPGAADVVHYLLRVPGDATEPITVDVSLRYRKFDTTYMRFFQGEAFDGNDLPIVTLATDRITFPLAGADQAAGGATPTIPAWERWNDYGIGLLRKGDAGANRGELRQAEAAFAEVERAGRPEGPLNRARVYIKEGRLQEAVEALSAAASFDPPAPAWSVAWFTGIVNKQNGFLDEAIDNFRSVVEMNTAETQQRGFDFSRDYRLLNELGQTIFERAKQHRGEAARDRRREQLTEAAGWFDRTLAIDPENVTAHYNLARLHELLGDEPRAAHHRALHAKYKPDDNARDRAVAAARIRYPAANHAAEAVVIYDLHRDGAPGLPPASPQVARHE